MKQFKTVFTFEFLEMARKRSVIITTAIMALILFGATFVPVLLGDDEVVDNGDQNVEVEPSNMFEHIGFVLDGHYIEETIKATFGNVKILASNEDAKSEIELGNFSKVVVFTGVDSYTLYANDLGTFDTDEMMISAYIEHLVRTNKLVEAGIDPDSAFEAFDVNIQVEHELLGKDSMQGFFMAYIIMFAIYMLILFFGQSVSTSIAREKDSRTMELLITSTKTTDLIVGKVMAMGTLGVVQMMIIAGAGVIGFVINKGSYPEFLIQMIQGTMSIDVILVYILFSVLGYILYLFIFASLGSLVSKVEDVGSSITPITMLFVVAFMIASFALQMPDSTIVVASSFIPFTSIFTMPIRYMLTTVSSMQLLMASAFMIVGVVLVAMFSIYVYRFGSLNYGNKIKLTEVFKSFGKKDA